jgi:DNA-binding NarL/FixJ family response regulator
MGVLRWYQSPTPRNSLMQVKPTSSRGSRSDPRGEPESAPVIETRRIRVTVVEEHPIFRSGLLSCLAEDLALEVSAAGPAELADHEVDIAVVSGEAARSHQFSCPIVVCDGADGSPSVADGNVVAGFLDRKSLTVPQLLATVRAAAAGLRVEADLYAEDQRRDEALEPRAVQLLELMAEGNSTREIATRMSYSERTIKKLITRLEEYMHARSRAQLIAEAMRRGLI